MRKVGIRELKTRLSHYIALVKSGEQIVVTERGREVAFLLYPNGVEELRRLVGEGFASWGGGKPQGSPTPVHVSGKPVSEIVVEERQ